MNTKNCTDWKDFKSCLEEIKGEVEVAKSKALPGVVFPELLYRGHVDASWKLETTLERYKDHFCDFYNYYRLILKIKSEVETFFGKKWKIPSLASVQRSEHFQKCRVQLSKS